MKDITYDVRVYRTRVYKGAKVTTYTVRWIIGKQEWTDAYRNDAQADSFRSSLVTAARNGEAFSLTTGRPVSWQRAANSNDMTWYDFACAYADMKWKSASAKYRKDIARALTAATPAMLTDPQSGRPSDEAMRVALRRWAFNTKQRDSAPADVAKALAWVARSTSSMSALTEPAMARRLLDAATTRLDGKSNAASTARRHRTILANAMDYARELKILTDNPIRSLKWKAPKVSSAVDRRCVVNPRQGRALLAAICKQQPSGPRLVAFFGAMYYAGLRPEEAINLAKDNLALPHLVWNKQTRQWEDPPDDKDWGQLHLRSAAPDAGSEWTDDGTDREIRPLKHRAPGDSRTVPVHPELTRLFRTHLRDFSPGPDDRLFTGIHGGDMPTITYRRAWTNARKTAFTPEEYASPLARRPYDLRHACLSTWLNGGVPPTQVAEWAGHSLDVLLRIYAKCLVGQDELARRRIAEALQDDSDDQGREDGQ
jgi:integrase